MTARRRAAARKMKQLKNASKDMDLDIEDDLDDAYSDFNGRPRHTHDIVFSCYLHFAYFTVALYRPDRPIAEWQINFNKTKYE